MNYYNPYFMGGYPYTASQTGLFSRLFNGINFSNILSGTQKTLNIVNQAIPLVKQAKPIISNARTMFRIMNEFKKVDTPTINKEEKTTNNETKKIEPYVKNDVGPTFFI